MTSKKHIQQDFFPEHIDNSIDIELNQKKNYSITKTMLNELSYGDLFRVWYGLNNISMHHQLMTSLNPHEIIAVYMGVQDIKYEKKNLHDKLSLVKPDDIYDIFKEANKDAYKSPALIKLMQDNKYRKSNVHSQKRGDLERRIRRLDYYPKWSFLVDFRMPAKKVQRDFYDPNYDDGGARGKTIYVNRIFGAMRGIYEKNKALVESPGYAIRSRPLTREEILEQTTLAYVRDVECCEENP